MSRCSQTDLADFLVVMILDRKITIVNKLFDMFTFFSYNGSACRVFIRCFEREAGGHPQCSTDTES